MFEVLLVVYIIIAVALVGFILIQQGKGADMGASLGAGASSGSMFGSSGAGNFLTKVTTLLATTFFILCIVLGSYISNDNKGSEGYSESELPAVEINSEIPSSVPASSDIPN